MVSFTEITTLAKGKMVLFGGFSILGKGEIIFMQSFLKKAWIKWFSIMISLKRQRQNNFTGRFQNFKKAG